MKTNLTKTSKFIALVLRHKPDAANIILDSEGWTSVSSLLKGLNSNGHKITLDELKTLVSEDTKGRYSFSTDGKKIRANQGHSTDEVNMTFEIATPPDELFHGTATSNLDSIYKIGLSKMKRHHVHLSETHTTAMTVGQRHGNPIALSINAKQMVKDGFVFYKSDNGVWLTDNVPAKYIAMTHFIKS